MIILLVTVGQPKWPILGANGKDVNWKVRDRTRARFESPQWVADGYVYFASDRGGAMNIWRREPTKSPA